jgi:hypothetical protein
MSADETADTATREFVIVDSSTPPEKLDALADDPTLVLDVTNFDLSLLWEQFKAALYTKSV